MRSCSMRTQELQLEAQSSDTKCFARVTPHTNQCHKNNVASGSKLFSDTFTLCNVANVMPPYLFMFFTPVSLWVKSEEEEAETSGDAAGGPGHPPPATHRKFEGLKQGSSRGDTWQNVNVVWDAAVERPVLTHHQVWCSYSTYHTDGFVCLSPFTAEWNIYWIPSQSHRLLISGQREITLWKLHLFQFSKQHTCLAHFSSHLKPFFSSLRTT